MLEITENSQNNFVHNFGILPKVMLRYVIYEKKHYGTDSWCSFDSPESYTTRSKKILQYSLDGVEWEEVPTVVIKLERGH